MMKKSVYIISILFVWAEMSMAGTGPHTILGNPNQTDGRLFQVDWAWDGQSVYDTTYDCRRTDPGGANHYLYFQIDDDYVYDGNYPIVHVAVLIYDFGTDVFTLDYESSNSTFKSVTATRTGTGGMKWFTFDLTDAKFSNGQQGLFDFRFCDCGSSALYVKSVYVWCRKEGVGTVSVDDGKFMLSGERFVMVGANYIAPWQTEWGNWSQMWKTNYNSVLVERDMTQMEKAGVNAIRTFLPFTDYICPSEDVLDSTVVQNIQDFCQRAENHGLKIIFCISDRPSWLQSEIVSDYGGFQWGDFWTNFKFRKEKADFLVQLINTAGLGQYDSFMAIDLQNEPTFSNWSGDAETFYTSLSRAGTLRAWNRWVNETYGSLLNGYAAWNYQGSNDTQSITYPEPESHFISSGGWDKKIDDYYAFIADSFVESTTYIRDRVREEALDRTLITIDFVMRVCSGSLTNDIQTVRLLTLDYKRLGAACDFVDLHIYGGYSAEDSWYDERMVDLLALGTDKPVVLSEFGRPASTTSSAQMEEQRVSWKGFMRISSTLKIDGCLGWMWIDSSDPSRSDSAFGLLSTNNTAKPAYGQFLQSKTGILINNEPIPDCMIDVDVDSYISPLEVFYQEGQGLICGLIAADLYPDMISGDRGEVPSIDVIYHLPELTGDPVVGSLGLYAGRGAVIMEDTIPDFMIGTLEYQCAVTAMNVGTNVWTRNDLYRLGTSDAFFGVGRWTLDNQDSISNGQIKTFSLSLVPPDTNTCVTRSWQMLQEQVVWFGQQHQHDVTIISLPERGARITNYTIPSVVQTGSIFQVEITVCNEGSAVWSTAGNYCLGAVGDSDPFASTLRHRLDAAETISSGETRTFTFSMTAPSEPGTYQSDWRMLQEAVEWFGQKIDVEVVVVEENVALYESSGGFMFAIMAVAELL